MFEGMRIERMIVHEIHKRNVGGDAIPPKLSDRTSPVPPGDAGDTLNERIVEVMGKTGKCIEMAIARADATSASSAAQSLLSADEAGFVAGSSAVAALLSDAQTTRTIPGGILLVFKGVAGNPARSFVGYLKAEPHTGFTRHTDNQHMTLEFVRDILLTKATRFYKIGVFMAPTATTANFPEGWQAFVYDDQISGDARSTASRYFFEAFLGCRFIDTASHFIREFYIHSKNFIRSMPIPETRKAEIQNALVSYLKVDQAQTVRVNEFSARFLTTDEERDRYERHMQENQVPAGALIKDLSAVQADLRFRKIKFSNRISIVGPPEFFNDMVVIESIDGDADQNGQRPTWTRITVKDHIRDQE